MQRFQTVLERQLARAARAAGLRPEEVERVSDPLDMASDLAARLDGAVVQQRCLEDLVELSAALEKIRRRPQEYGRCERCGDPIATERLELMPAVRSCRGCA